MRFQTRLSVKLTTLACSSVVLLTTGFPALGWELETSPQTETESKGQYGVFGSSINDSKYPTHFTINDIAHEFSESDDTGFQNPFELLGDFNDPFEIDAQKTPAVSLIDWIEHRVGVPTPRKPYDRRSDYGPWQTTKGTCLDVRGMVLEKHSQVPIKTKPSMDRCVVTSGKWNDPYTADVFDKPYPNIEIDHFVPLKNAHQMGASHWPAKKRCWYANFYKNDFHLLPVSARENERKGDATPHDYIPPRSDYQCEYVRNWLAVKLIWKLALVPPEVKAIEEVIRSNRCTSAQLRITQAELKKQRLMVEAGSELCK